MFANPTRCKERFLDCAGRRFSDKVGIFDRRSENGRKSKKKLPGLSPALRSSEAAEDSQEWLSHLPRNEGHDIPGAARNLRCGARTKKDGGLPDTDRRNPTNWGKARHYESPEAAEDSQEWLSHLLRPLSSCGGCFPPASLLSPGRARAPFYIRLDAAPFLVRL